MKLLIILSACLALSSGKVIPLNENLSPANDEISCSYGMMGSQYTCTLSINNPQGRDDFTAIPGEHLPGMTNDDVTFVYGMNQTSRNVPRIFCQTFPNLLDFLLEMSQVEILSAEAFADCRAVEFIILGINNIRTIPDRVFANNERLEYVFLQMNNINSISAQAFAGNNRISMLDLGYNELNTYNTAWFRPIASTLTHLYLNTNRFQILPFFAFGELQHLINLDVGRNNFISIPPTAFYGLMSLQRLNLDRAGIRVVDPAWFTSLLNVTGIFLQGNLIRNLQPNTFNNLNRLTEINLDTNNLLFVHRDAFGSSLNSLLHLTFSNNLIEAIDQQIIDEGNLLWLILTQNECVSENFYNVGNELDRIRVALDDCFTNFVGSVACEYVQFRPDSYECVLSINNPVGRDFERIDGDHLQDRTNDDVRVVEAIMQNSRTVPAVLCRTFPNVEDIWFELSRIEFINEGSFEHCANLWRVNLNDNGITTIPDNTFRNNPNLEVFYAIVNRIDNIGNSAFAGTRLRDINLEDNFLTNYNPAVFNTVAGSLEELNLAYNRITRIPPQAFSNLRVLEYLTFSDNRVGRIPSDAFRGLISLTHWEFENCDIAEVNPEWFVDSRQLQDIRLDGNTLRSLPSGVFNGLENLLTVSISNNRIRNINLNAFGNSLNSLVLLYANANGIRAFDDRILAQASRLATLQLGNNFCVNSQFFNVQGNLEDVRAALSECFRMFEGFVRCNYVRVRDNYICHLEIQNVQPRDDHVYIEGQHMTDMTNNDVTILDAMRQESLIIPSVICRQFPNLRDLYIDESHVEYINEDAFEHCTNLEWLDLYGNNIATVPDFTFANSPRLTSLYLLLNRINHVGTNAFAGTSINIIEFDFNQLETIDARWFTPIRDTIQYLYFTHNIIHEIPENTFEGLSRVEILGLGDNLFETFPSRVFHPLTALKFLYLQQNHLTQIDPQWFDRNQALEFVSFYRNQIEDIPAYTFGNHPNLHEVDFGHNRLRLLHSDIFSPNVPALSFFMADFNSIDFIDPAFYDGLRDLSYLYLFDSLCINRNFYNVNNNRNTTRDALQGCFEHFNRVNPIDCIYVEASEFNYACYMTVNNLPGNDNAEAISGEHAVGRTDEDVGIVFLNFQVTRTIPSVICRQFPNLQELWADMSEIQTLNQRTFADCANLQALVIEFNPIHVIPTGAFLHNQRLNILWLDFNHIHTIEPGAFTGTAISSLGLGDNDLHEYNLHWFDGIRGTLADIYLYENYFTTMPGDAFNGLNALEYLDFGLNPHLVIPGDIFSSLANPSILKELRFDSIGITEIHPQWFTHLMHLEVLHIHNNNIRNIPDNAFTPLIAIQQLFVGQQPLRFIGIEAFGNNPLTNLSWLNLMSSELHAFDEQIFNRAENLEFLYLYGNPCVSINFYQVNNNRDNVREQLAQCFDNFVGSLSCQYINIPGYPYMCEVRINNVAGRNFDSITGNHVGTNTNADVRLLEGLGQRTRTIPSILCSTFTNLEEIYITNSEIEVLTDETFAGCAQLDRLTLAYNNIHTLPNNLFSSNPNLGWFSIRTNQVSQIHDNAFTGSRLDVIELANNQLTSVNSNAFAVIGSTLEVLDLSINRIAEIPSNSFTGLPILKDLDLSRNPGLIIPSDAFAAQQELHDLILNEIGLRVLHDDLFRHTTNLTFLSLAGNHIRRIPDDIFSNLRILQTLVLRNNNINTLSVYQFGWESTSLISLITDNNRVNAVDIRLFDQMAQLNYFYLQGNVCANQNFANIQNNRVQVRNNLMTCFENFGIDEPDMK